MEILFKQCQNINYEKNVSKLYVTKILLYVDVLSLVFASQCKITSAGYCILEHLGKLRQHFMRLSHAVNMKL